MCGIAGYIGTAKISQESIQACLASMSRRGPDHLAFEHEMTPSGSNVYLLYSRLKIIDLDDRANQPQRLGGKKLIFNGELYNHKKIRQRHIQAGHKFKTSSDTEIFLKALSGNAMQGLDECEGMWAFALYDSRDSSLLLGRDRYGEKPLYIAKRDDGIYFASELKALVILSGERTEINFEHLYRYLVNGYRSLFKGGHCFFKGVEKVPPGYLMRLQPGEEPQLESYWKFEFERDETLTYSDAVAMAREALEKSLEIRLESDVPLAFCLSGGIDSTALVSIAKRVFDYDVHGFTVANTDKKYDEREMVAMSVAELGIRHSWVPVETNDFLPRLQEQIRYHDSPISTITSFAHWRMMHSVSEFDYRITISGLGADELFSGYYDHHNAYLYEVRDDTSLYTEALNNWKKHIYPLIRNPSFRDPNLFINDPEERDYIYGDTSRQSKYLIENWSEQFYEKEFCSDLLRNRMMNELFHESVPVLLHEDDLNAMYYSIENRSPYLDRNLFDTCQRIPTRHLVRDGMAKSILRDAVRDVAPSHVLDCREKVGFNAPLSAFLDLNDKNVRQYLLDDSPIYENINKAQIEELILGNNFPDSESMFLFSFVNAKMFIEEFGKSGGV